MSSLLSHKSIRVKKSTHGTHPDKVTGQIGPADVLIDRNQQWKHITKSLLHHYKGLSAIQSSTAKATQALTEGIQVPFHEGHNFLGSNGWQEALYTVRDQTRVLADHHAKLADTIDKTVVKELEEVRRDIKQKIDEIEKDAKALQHEVEKERQASTRQLTQLNTGIETFETSAHQMQAKDDPYLTHKLTVTQLTRQVHKENDLQTSLIKFQSLQPAFEIEVARNIQKAAKLYDEHMKAKVIEMQAVEEKIRDAIQHVGESAEWEFYSALPGSLIDPNTPLRQVDAITFPGFNHAASYPLKEGLLERKKRFTKSYTEKWFVVSRSGYLHERRGNDDEDPANLKPAFSLFLPECSLGQPAKPSDKSHKFHIEGLKAEKSTLSSRIKSIGGKKEIAYSFRARTHEEMMAWWTVLDGVVRDTKPDRTASSKVVVGPIQQAVAGIGYAAPATAAVAAVEVEASEVASTTTGTVPPESEIVDQSSTSSVEEEEVEEEEDEEEEEGGSSAEEEDEEHFIARTAPTTPAVINASVEDPIAAGEHEKAEVLPTYSGDGTTPAEKAALLEKGKPAAGGGGILSSIFGSSSPAPATVPPVASTSAVA